MSNTDVRFKDMFGDLMWRVAGRQFAFNWNAFNDISIYIWQSAVLRNCSNSTLETNWKWLTRQKLIKKLRWNSIKSSNRKCQLLRKPWLSCKLKLVPFTACCCQKLFGRRLWHHTSCTVYAWVPECWKPIKPYHRLRGTTHAHTASIDRDAPCSILIEEHSSFFALFLCGFRFRHGFSCIHRSYLLCLMYNYLRIKL